MTREEARIIRHRLDDYQSYKTLAFEADKKALLTQERIRDLGYPKAISWGKIGTTQNHVETASILNQLITDQDAYEKEAAKYHQKMKDIEAFIDDNFVGLIHTALVGHYIDGINYIKLSEEFFIEPCSLTMQVIRAIECLDFDKAKAIIS